MCDKSVLDEITSRVCTAAKEVLGGKLEKVILFGSYARGDYDEESDIDIMIIADIALEEANEVRRKIHARMEYIDLEHDAVVCLSMACSDIFHKHQDISGLYINVRKDGMELYAA